MLACTKDVNLITEVEFQLVETHQREGFINEELVTSFTVIPEAELEGYEYFFTYTIVEGAGFYINAEGEQLPEGSKIALDSFSAQVMYVGTQVGDHRITIKAEDSFGFTEETEITYSISNVPAVWTATSPNTIVEVDKKAEVVVTLQSGVDNAGATYEWNYQIISGSGMLLIATDLIEVEPNNFEAITPAVYQFVFVPDALGTAELQFNLRDSNGQELEDNLVFEVVEEIIDESPPTITILGENPVDVFIGTTYTDAGATAEDDIDGDLTASIATDLTAIDTSTEGAYEVVYTVSDAAGNEAREVRVVNVIPNPDGNQPPVAVDDIATVEVNQGISVLVLLNDTDVDTPADELVVTGATDLTPDFAGTLEVTPEAVTYTPTTDFIGEVSFIYTINDGNVGNDASATVTITVTEGSTNQPPTANDFAVNVDANSVNNAINVSGEISDPENDALTVSVGNGNTPNGSATVSGNTISYTPNTGFTGEDTVIYTVDDGINLPVEGTITITVVAITNTPPTANDFTVTVLRNSSNNDIQVSDQISDPDNDALTVTIQAGSPMNGSADIIGTLITYTPGTDFVGNDQLIYLVDDGNNPPVSGTITIAVTTVPNDPPTANSFAVTFTGDSVNNAIDVAGEISDPENDPLTVSLQAGSPTNGTASVAGTVISYSPNSGFTGQDTITYLVDDGNNPPVSAIITITVSAPPNGPPTANNFAVTVEGNSTNNAIDVAAFIGDPENDPLTVTIQGGSPAEGTATISGTIISYTPNNGFTGNDVITYLVNDGSNPLVSATITITVSVPPNRPPTANNFSVNVLENSTNNTIDVATQINDLDNDPLTVSIQAGSPSNGTANINGTVISYTPTNGFTGDVLLVYLVDDGNNPPVDAVISITVTDVPNDPPTANNFGFSVVENSTNNPIDVAGEINDPENDPLTITIQGGSPTNGTATVSGTVISYTPNTNYSGPDTIVYLVDDGNNPPVNGTISITVTPMPNGPPTAANQNISVVGNSTNSTIDLTALISDPDNDPLVIDIQAGTPANGTATISGVIITYTPNIGFTGNDIIIYTVDDGINPAVSGTLTIMVSAPANLPPTAQNITTTVQGNSTNNPIDVASSINDPENDPLIVTIQAGSPLNGTATVSGTIISYTPNNGFTGNEIITYLVDDGNNPLVSANIMITVTNAPDTTPPVIVLVGGAVSITTGQPYTEPGFTATDNVDGNITGAVVVTSNLDTNTPGTYTLQYNVSDAAGNAAQEQTRTVTVTNAPDTTPPVIVLVGGAVSITTGQPYTEPGFTATDNVDGDLTGAVVVTSNLDTNTPGTYTLQYNVSDAAGNAAQEQTRTVTVTNAPDTTPPVIVLVGGAVSITAGQPYTEPGFTATDNVDGNITGAVVVTSNLDTNTPGTYTLQYNVSDAAGNAAQEQTRTVTVTAATILITAININPPNSSIEVGQTQQLTANITPSNATNQSLSWTSNNNSVATVDGNGLVTAVAEGSAVITALALDGSGVSGTANITVSVANVPVTGIEVTPETSTVEVGQPVSLIATILPANATNTNVNWITSNNSLATVDGSGNVTTLAVGNVTITAISVENGSITDSAVITIVPANVPVTGILVFPVNSTINVGGNQQFTVSVLPANATDPSVIWSTSNASIASIDSNGNVTGAGAGTATITATSVSNPGVSNSTGITVNAVNQLPTADIRIGPSTEVEKTFNGNFSSDPDGTIVEYRWDFGDGNTRTTTTGIVTHTYSVEGTFTVSLIVEDNDGGLSAPDQLNVVVTFPPPPAYTFEIDPIANPQGGFDPDTDIPITFRLQPNTGAVAQGITFQMQYQIIGNPGLSILEYDGNFYGDGNIFTPLIGTSTGIFTGSTAVNCDTLELRFTVTNNLGLPSQSISRLINYNGGGNPCD